MKIIFNLFLLTLFFLNVQSCNSEEPLRPDEKSALTLKLEDVSCTEVWVTLTTTNLQLPTSVILKQNDQTRTTIYLSQADTLLYIDSLLPNTNYLYQVSSIPQSGGQQQVSSNEVAATTLDTTSHNFTFETFTFGGTAGSSTLYDVAIIDENNIWAVGEINIADTSINGYTTYNAVHWDGSEWVLKKIYYYGSCSAVEYPPLKAIWAFSDTNIVVTNGGSIGWFDGNTVNLDCRVNPLLTGAINKIWGSSSENLYVIGNNGNIAHYNGTLWSRIESGTELPLVDIYSQDGNEIYISGAYTPETKGVLLKGNATQFSVMIYSEIITENELFDKLYGELASVWVDDNGTVYTGGNLLFRHKNNVWNYETSLPENFIGGNPGAYYRGFITSIRGNASNDYIVAGDRNTLRHFNGVSWEQIGLPYSPSSPIIWYKVEQKGSTAVAVGDRGSYAFIILLNK